MMNTMTRRTEAEIMKNWPEDGTLPLVTVIAICYCHEKYIRTALDSILAQETNFPFEVLVHDDASTDDSAAIIEEYAENYPHLIVPILEQENQFSKGNQALLKAVKPGIRGKYLAYLECDDYWTDSNKLQEQVDFLETHPAFLAVAHNCTVVDADGIATGEKYPECKDEEYTMDHFLHDTLAGQIATLVVRDIFTQNIGDHWLMMNASQGPFDRAVYLTLLLNGRIFCIQKSMSAYRHITNEGTSYSATYHFDIERETRFYLSFVLMCKRMGRTGDAIGMLRWLLSFLEQFVSSGIIGKEKASPYLELCQTSIDTLSDQLNSQYRHCICCGRSVRYEPMPIKQQEIALSINRLFLPETLNPDAYLCPVCGCMDWERLMIAALNRMDLPEKAQKCHILQISPSHVIDRWFRERCPNAIYETCDINIVGGNFQGNLQNMSNVSDESYDLIVCSDILQRMQDDRKALCELKRIMKKDGCILLFVQVDRSFSGVDEAWGGLSKGENLQRFGHDDFIRRYSRDGLLERLEEQFTVQLLGKDLFGEECYYQAGLSDSSTLYVLSKPENSASFFDTQLPEQVGAYQTKNKAKLVVYIQELGDVCYSEDKAIRTIVPLQNPYYCRISLYEFDEIAHLRIDPTETPCFLREITVMLTTEDGKLISAPILSSNGLACFGGLLFNSNDPQIEIQIPQGRYREVSFFSKQIFCDSEEFEYIRGILDERSQLKVDCEKLNEELIQTNEILINSNDRIKELTAQLTLAKRDYDIISNSEFWKLTKPARKFADTLKKPTHMCKEIFKAKESDATSDLSKTKESHVSNEVENQN